MDEQLTTDERECDSWRWPLIVAAFCALCYYSLEHSWTYAGRGNQTTDQEERLETAIAVTQLHTVVRDGSLAVLALGGAAMVVLGRGQPWMVNRLLAVMCGAVVLWILLLFPMAEAKSHVFRRLVGCFGALTFAVGCARWLTPREVVRMVWGAFGGFVCFALVADVLTGGNPLGSDYRFSGTLHPNSQGIYCAMVCMASICLIRWERDPWLFKAAGAAAFVLLILTKSRGSLFALVGALLVMWIAARERLTRVQAWASIATLAAVFVFAYACMDVGTVRVTREALLLGRTEDAGSFSGRVPLWEELAKVYAPKHIWTGYGFGGFWTEDHIEELYQSQKWAMGNAHNLFLDLVLQTGVIGLCLVAATICCLFSAAGSYRAVTRDDAYLFYTGMFAFVLVNSLMEALFLHPTKMATELAMLCAMSLTFFTPAAAFARREVPAYAGRGIARPLSLPMERWT